MPETPQKRQRAPQNELPITDYKQRSQELGLFGKIFGSREHAPVNIAGAIVLIGIIGMVFVIPVMPDTPSLDRADMLKSLGALVLAALTFLGGYLGGGKTH
jgi:hypothetical protein